MKSKRMISLTAVISGIFILFFSDNAVMNAHADFGGVGHSGGGHSFSHSSHSYRSHHSGTHDFEDILLLLIIVGFGVFVYLVLRGISERVERKHREYNVFTIQPDFDKDNMTDHVRNIFTELQEAWMIRDISSVRRYLTDRYFAKNQKILERTLIKPDLYNIITEIDIRYVKITKCAKKFGKYVFKAEIKAKMLDYIIKKDSAIVDGDVVMSGSSKIRVCRIYNYEFECSENSANIEDWKLKSIVLVKKAV